jgi:hypothetical protein
VLPPLPPPDPTRGAATGMMGSSPDEVDFPPCPVLPPDVLVELALDPPDDEVLEVLEVLLLLVFVDVVC